jgi:hypothetical protein
MTDFMVDHQRCNIWADVGVGKSVAGWSAADMLWLAGSNAHPLLALAPPRVARGAWIKEQQKWDHLAGYRVVTLSDEDTTPQQRRAALNTKADVYSINYENVQWLVEELKGRKWPFPLVIADESTRLKNYRLNKGGKRAAALATIATSTIRWWNFSGTAASNGLKNLWGPQWFVDFGASLGQSYSAYMNRWFRTDPYSRAVEPMPFAQEQIQDRLRPTSLTIVAKDWFDIKDPVIVPREVEIPANLMHRYKKLEREMYTELLSGTPVEVFNAAAKSSKCLQFASGAVYTDKAGTWEEVHKEKLFELESIVEETAGAPLLVSYWWKHDLARILGHFPQARHIQSKRDEDDFADGKIHIGVVNPLSCGHGIDGWQKACRHVVFFSDWWDLETHDQVIGRVGPMRQYQIDRTEPVFVYVLLAKNTVDGLVHARHASKRSVQDLLMESARRMK